MKAILLAGGKGTRLRPLTVHTPKPIVPIFDRPFLRYQIELLRRMPEIDEIILSLNYQPSRIEEVFGEGQDMGVRLRYVVEPMPLGTAGAVKYAEEFLDDSVIVFNGDVLTGIDLPAVVRLHRERRARATIVLTPVENPTGYGLVETDVDGNVRRFLEKPKPEEITCDTINAGIYVLEPDTFDRIPSHTAWSIERSYFPSLVDRGDTFVAYVYDGYWIDIGTPEKYRQVHRDILAGRFPVTLDAERRFGGWVHSSAELSEGAVLEPPFYVGPGCRVAEKARIGPDAVLVAEVRVDAGALVRDSVLWAGGRVGSGAELDEVLAGTGVQVGSYCRVRGAVLGEGSVLTDHSQVP